jgi:hypothetical protein
LTLGNGLPKNLRGNVRKVLQKDLL